MTRAWRFALALSLGGTLCAPAAAREPKVGEPAPDAELILVNGSHVKLAELRGQVVVINFWATWCVPCKRKLPLLDAYYDVQKAHGLRVFAATTEDSVPERALRALFGKMHLDPVRRLKGS